MNSIGIESFYQEGYDSYPKGSLKIDNIEKQADLTFQVQNVNKRTYVNKKTYIFLSLIIIMIEIFAFFGKMRYNGKAWIKKLVGGL